MSLRKKTQVAIPAGEHSGKIVMCEETSKTFDPEKGPEPVIEITIRPEYSVKGAETLDVSVVFSPILNGLSALDKLLQRLEIAVKDGEYFDPKQLVGTQVEFSSAISPTGFVRVDKSTIRQRGGGKNAQLPAE